MEKLSTPIAVKTNLGPINATHRIHNISFNESGEPALNSSIIYGIEVDGKVCAIKEQSNRALTGDELNDLGIDEFLAKVRTRHEAIVEAESKIVADATSVRKAQLEAQIAALSSEAAKL